MLKKRFKNSVFYLTLFSTLALFSACDNKKSSKSPLPPPDAVEPPGFYATAGNAVNFKHELDSYKPKKTSYNFYFTYKINHSWWDAVAMGVEDAVNQFEDRGIQITYDYLAPVKVSAQDQADRIRRAAASGEYDVIGVDVCDIKVITPVINEILKTGQKVMTFSSSDSSKEDGCNRIAYVGNTHNYEDGCTLAETLCKRLNYKGEVALLVGNDGAPCHEQRARGAQDVISKYRDMKVVEIGFDEDDIDSAYSLTLGFIKKYPRLAGIIGCDMSNPVGAARAVIDSKKIGDVIIVGMDHDQEALRYLRDGIIYSLGVQDCYSIGFDTMQVAVKIADGVKPGEGYPEKTEESTTMIYQADASLILLMLYGELSNDANRKFRR